MSMRCFCAMMEIGRWYILSPVSKVKDDVFHSVTQVYSEKENPSAHNSGSQTCNLPVTSSDALPLSYRRLARGSPF